MSKHYVVCNQLNQFWGRKKRWADGSKPRDVAVFKHEDEGLNQLVELSARDVELRGHVLAVETDERGLPVVTVSEHRIVEEDDLLAEVSDHTTETSSPTPQPAVESS